MTIRSTIQGSNEVIKETVTYPCIRTYNGDKPFTVLFTSPATGFIIHSNELRSDSIGYYSTGWSFPNFSDRWSKLNGQVLLEDN